MNVLLLTVFISVLLAVLFVVLFLEDHRLRQVRSVESLSLLPLEDDAAAALPPAVLVGPAPGSLRGISPGHGHDHDHDHGHDHARAGHPCPNNGKCCGDCKKRKSGPKAE
jgi:hypothetical protein